MILIGEKLNSSIPRAQQAFEARDAQTVTELIRTQAAAGASFLDVNTAVCAASEQAAMLWTIGLIRENCDCGIMIDTADPKVMAAAVQAAGDCPLILNSATITDRFDAVTALAKESGAAVVGLPIDDDMPHSLEEKCQKLDFLIEKLRAAGIQDDRIYADVLVETLATDGGSAKSALGAIAYMAENYPDVKTFQRLWLRGFPARSSTRCHPQCVMQLQRHALLLDWTIIAWIISLIFAEMSNFSNC